MPGQISPELLSPGGYVRGTSRVSYTTISVVQSAANLLLAPPPTHLSRDISKPGSPVRTNGQPTPLASENCQRNNKDREPAPLVLPTPANAEARRNVLVVSLERSRCFDKNYQQLIGTLEPHLRFEHAIEEEISFYLNQSNLKPDIILITDAGILGEDHEHALEILLQLRDFIARGGTIILAFDFGRAPFSQMNGFFKGLGLDWKAGAVWNKRVFLEPGVAKKLLGILKEQMADRYRPEAMCLAGVDRGSRMYVPWEDVRYDGKGPHLSPVAWEQVGKGWVGFVGDLKGNENSWRIVLAMCGL